MPKIVRILTALVCALSLTACPAVNVLMRGLGYTPLKPPSLLLQPGALVYIKTSNSGEFSAGLLCGPRASLGSHWKPMRSPTAPASISRVKGASFNMDAKLMSEVQADLRFQNIQKITMSLANATIVELSDIDVIDNVRYRSDGCRQAIKARIAAGYKVTMVQSALLGNVTYSISWDQNFKASAQAKIDVLSQLALELGGGVTSVGEQNVKAENLVWGLIDSPYLASLSIPEMNTADYTPSTHLIGPQVDATITPVPDTPIVKADHETYNDQLPIKTPNLPPIGSSIFKQEQTTDWHGDDGMEKDINK